MASSSATNYSYDVFLSFRGTDTCNNFTSHLHEALCRKNVKAFIDNINIERGKEITPFLEQIIEGAKLSIIVFSSDYASSTFCLDEMLKIMKCKETKAQIVLPIFYKTYPSEDTYTKAFATHEHAIKLEVVVDRLKSYFWRTLHWMTFSFAFKRYEEIISQEMIERWASSYQKLERWRSCFQKALELAGWHIGDNRNEAIVIDEITRDVLERLNCLLKGEMKISTMIGETSENYLEKIMECLMNDENSKIGVWGIGGVGKTTIVKHIYNKLLHDATFSPHIYWVTVSKDSSISKLQHDLAKVIKLDLCGEDNEGIVAAKLFNELKRISKFVLILDDVWEPFEIEEVGIPLMGRRKLLLTSRSRRVCERMNCELIHVKPLSKHESLDLFIKESQCQINDSYEGRRIMQSIVEECEGLPLALVVVARTMRRVTDTWKWRDTLRELQTPHCERENPEIEKKVFKVLKFSYDRLPNDRSRQCFLYCSLFPEDYLFQRNYLIEYWIGEGLINEGDNRQAALDKGNVILHELLHSSLLNDDCRYDGFDYDGGSSVKMHDVIRDMALNIVIVGLHFQDPLERVQVVGEAMLKKNSNLALDCFKLRTLVLNNLLIEGLSGCFFANMQNLNVLHITDLRGDFNSVPDFITNLGNLRLLIITRPADRECIPSLVGLEKLQYLKISRSRCLKEIPKGIDILVNLRVLELLENWYLHGSFPSGVLKKLSHLQILDLGGSNVEVESDELVSLEKLQILRVEFHNLHKFLFYIKSDHWQKLVDYQINYGAHIVHKDENGNRRKKGMCLSAIGDVSGIILTNDIQNLKLSDWESPMFNLLKNSTFGYLQTLVIRGYRSRYLFTVDLAQQLLHNVQELCLYNCYSLEEIILGRQGGEEWVKSSNYPTIWLPKLKRLKLSSIYNLRSIYRGKMACPCLELIEIDFAEKIERFPFCLKTEGHRQNPTIQLKVFLRKLVLKRWWDELRWDEPDAKSMYQLFLFRNSRFHPVIQKQNPIFDCESESE